MRSRIMKDPHHRRIPSVQHPRNPPRPPSIPPRRRLIHQNLIPLHRTVQLIRRNKKIVAPIHTSIRPHKPIPIPMQIQTSRHQPVPNSAMLHRHLCPTTFHSLRLLRSRRRQTPLLALRLHQLAPSRNPRKLLQQQPPLAPTTQPKLANQLFIPNAMPRRALNQPHQLTISLRIGSVCHRLRAYSRPLNFAVPRSSDRLLELVTSASRSLPPVTRLRHLRSLLQRRSRRHLHKLRLHLILLLSDVLKEQDLPLDVHMRLCDLP